MCLHANGSNRAVSKRLGGFSALSRKTARVALFFTCYYCLMCWDGFHEKTSKNVGFYMRTAQTGLFQSVWVNSVLFRAKRLGSRSVALVMKSLMCWGFPREKMEECVCLLANSSNLVVSERLGQFSALSRKTPWVMLFYTCYEEFDVLGVST